MSLRMAHALYERIVQDCRARHPKEACGVVAAKLDNLDRPIGTPRLIPMRNVLDSEHAYQFDPEEQLAVWREMEAKEEEPWVIYHSHTVGGPSASTDDAILASEPNAHYLIIATAGQSDYRHKVYRLVGGQFRTEDLTLTYPGIP